MHPDVITGRRISVRRANIHRGAAPHGGPGYHEIRRTNRLAQKFVAGTARTEHVQRYLRKAGYNVKVDGVWGPETAHAWNALSGSNYHAATHNAGAKSDYMRSHLPLAPDHARDVYMLGPELAREFDQARQRIHRYALHLQHQRLAAYKAGRIQARPLKEPVAPKRVDTGKAFAQYEQRFRPHEYARLQRYSHQYGLEGNPILHQIGSVTRDVLKYGGGITPADARHLGHAGTIANLSILPFMAVGGGGELRALAAGGAEAVRVLRGTEEGARAIEGLKAAEEGLTVAERASLAQARRSLAVGRRLTMAQKYILARVEKDLAVQLGRTGSLGRIKAAMAVARGERSWIGKGARKLLRMPVGRTSNRIRPRVFKLGGREETVAGAGSIPGYAVERAYHVLHERVLPAIEARLPYSVQKGKPLTRWYERRAAREFARNERSRVRQLEQPMREMLAAAEKSPRGRLFKVLRTKRLTDPERYALRIAAEGTTPAKRIAFHERQRAIALAEGKTRLALYHTIHIHNIDQASKFIAVRDTPVGERAFLSKDAPANLQAAFHAARKVVGTREKFAQELGLLTDEAIARRTIAPARVFEGATWTPHEEAFQTNMSNNPLVRALDKEAEQIATDPAQAGALKQAYRQALRHASFTNTEPDLAAAERLAGVTRHLAVGERLTENNLPPELHTLYQATHNQVSADVQTGVAETLGKQSGHTWNRDLTSDREKSGFAVGQLVGGQKIAASKFTVKDVADFRERNWMYLGGPLSRVGAWRSEGTVYLDVAHIFPTEESALAAARKNVQIAIWDRAKGREIKTGITKAEQDAAYARISQGEIPLMAQSPFAPARLRLIPPRPGLGEAGGATTLFQEAWRPVRTEAAQARRAKEQAQIVRGYEVKMAEAKKAAYAARASHDAEAAKRHTEDFLHWKKARDAAQQAPLLQRAGSLNTISPISGIKGATVVSGTLPDITATFRFSEASDASTVMHEVIGHGMAWRLPEGDYQTLRKWAGGNFDPTRGEVDRQAAEKVANGLVKSILTNQPPPRMGNTFKTLERSMRDSLDGIDVPAFTPAVSRVFSRLFEAGKLEGGALLGAEHIKPYSEFRVPFGYGRPLPTSLLSKGKQFGVYTRMVFSPQSKALSRTLRDPTFEKAFTDRQLKSGYFQLDPIRPLAADLARTIRLTAVQRAHEAAKEMAVDLPMSRDWLAVKMNPDEETPENLRTIMNHLGEVEATGGRLSARALDILSPQELQDAGLEVFPAQVDGMDIKELAAKVLNEQTPYENIKWVPRFWLEEAGLLPTGFSMGKVGSSRGLHLGAVGFDAFNDVNRLAVLYFNPAYYAVNLVGNVGMNFMQQGFMTPVNLWRGALMHSWLGVEKWGFIDAQMGEGLTYGLTHTRFSPGQALHNTIGNLANRMIDLVPRRAAWLHAARQHGYASNEAVADLIDRALAHDESAMQDIQLITSRAAPAIVDYERLSPLEKEFTRRLIWFYPWIKGATHWTIRYPMEHPYQAAILGAVGQHAYEVQQQKLGPTPYYAKFEMPVSTDVVGVGPYSLSDVVGQHEWHTQRGGQDLPYTFGIQQLITATTPMQLADGIVGMMSNDPNRTSLVENLTPAVYNIAVALFGYDPFRHKEVPRTIWSFVNQMTDMPQVQRFGAITASTTKERSQVTKRMYPRNREEAWWQVFGSSIAPKPYNLTVAAERVKEMAPTGIRHQSDALDDAKKYHLPQPPLQEMQGFDEFQHQIQTGMTPPERLQVMLPYFYQQYPQYAAHVRAEAARVKNYGDAQRLYDGLSKYLFLKWRHWNYLRDRAKGIATAKTPVNP